MWLNDQDELRGQVALAGSKLGSAVPEGSLGSALETVQIIVTSGTSAAFVTSLFAWLRHRRTTSKVSLEVTSPGGRHVKLTCAASDDVGVILAAVTEFLEGEDQPSAS